MQTAFKSSHKFQEEWDREMSLARGPLPLLGQKSRERGKQFYREKGFRKRKLEAPRGMVSRERRPMGTLRVEGAPHLSPVPPQHGWLWRGGGVASVNQKGTVCTVHTSHRFLSCMFH